MKYVEELDLRQGAEKHGEGLIFLPEKENRKMTATYVDGVMKVTAMVLSAGKLKPYFTEVLSNEF